MKRYACAMIMGLMAATLSAGLTATPALAGSEQGQAQTRGIYLQMIQQARVDGRSRAALAYLDDFDRTYPGDVEALVLRINCLLDLRQVDEADTMLARLRPADHTGRFAAEVNAVHGHVLGAHDRWGEATPFYAAAVAANPTSPMLRNALGYSLLRDHQPARGLEAIRDARDLAPEDTIIRNNLLLAYAVNGRDALLAHGLDTVSDPDARNALRRRINVEAAKLRGDAVQPALAVAASGAFPAKTIQTSVQKAY